MIVFFERTIYMNPENGYSVIKCSTDEPIDTDKRLNDSAFKFQLTGKYGLILVGNYLFSTDGTYDIQGKWTKSTKYGTQFSVDMWSHVIGGDRESVVLFLCSFDGIGHKTADAIYDKFGSNTEAVVRTDIDQLLKVKGVSPKKVNAIKTGLNDTFRSFSTKALKFGVSMARIKTMYETHGDAALSILCENPFRLCGSDGLTFREANAIALSLGVALVSKERFRTAILYFLYENERRGNTVSDCATLIDTALSFLNKSCPTLITEQMLVESIKFMNKGGSIHVVKQRGDTLIVSHGQYISEKYCGDVLASRAAISACASDYPLQDIDQAMQQAQLSMSCILNKEQLDAVRSALQNRVSVITGGPGTGKSTILNALISAFNALHKRPPTICLCAPTGRAAKRMRESTGLDASTIHSALYLTVDNMLPEIEEYVEELLCDIVVVDEVSMMDSGLIYRLIKAVDKNAKIVLIGDADQLPSVQAGNVLADIINSNVIPVSRLQTIYRQQETSNIVVNADKMRKNKTDFDFGDDFSLVAATAQQAETMIVDAFMTELTNGSLDTVQILSPFRKASVPCSTSKLNLLIQERLHKTDERKMTVHKNVFYVGDKVIQEKNDDFIKNGDIGYISSIYEDDDVAYMDIRYGDHVETYDADKIDELKISLAYAITVHKSQGAEYDVVLMPILREHVHFLWKNLLYTAITRAKEKVMLFGDASVFCQASTKVLDVSRKSLLCSRLQQNAKKLSTISMLQGEQLSLSMV